MGRSFAPMVDHVRSIVDGPGAEAADRALGTILFTDIVGSTDLLARMGDHAYGALRDEHERTVRLTVEDFGGRLLKVIGDGTLSLFDGPIAALRCADRLSNDAAALGVPIRAGVHTGEVQRSGGDVAGMTVHIGARIAGLAGQGEILLSRAVRDLTSGAGLSFRDCGARELRGVPGRWDLYALDHLAAPHDAAVGQPLALSRTDAATLAAARRSPGALRALSRASTRIRRLAVRT
jgi:class 3 adenylate cyclase